jgi:hypothetical protein
MAVGFMRWLRCADTIQTADGIAATIENDVAPINDGRGNCCTRENVRNALNHGGDRPKGLQAGARPDEGHYQGRNA